MIYTVRVEFGAWGEDPTLDRARLEIMQEALQKIAHLAYARHPNLPSVYEKCRYRWESDPTGRGDAYKDVLACIETRSGDCADFSPARAGELGARYGIPATTVIVEQPPDAAGRARGHVVVATEHSTEDPALALGMTEG